MPRTPSTTPTTLMVGVDTGGTFTDLVFCELRGRRVEVEGRLKVLSTPEDPAEAVLEGLRQLFGDRRPDLFTYGTTVATNAMLERRGARTALVTTAGFEDVLEIGRQARPALYDLEPRRAEPLVAPALRVGVRERMHFDGEAWLAPSARELARVASAVRRSGAASVAVCLLHSAIHPRHELAVGRALARLGLPVSLSHVLSPTVGEFERTSTAVANAYVQPKVAGHIDALARRSRARRMRVMQSSGGAVGAATAAREPVRTMLSGPAGGVAAAAAVAAAAGAPRIVTVDMGGTSTDVAFVAGEAPRRADTWIGGFALRVPCLDIHTVGAGGGSIAAVDEGGALGVGPRSAGASPGPACYGRGTEPTVTDANVLLGRLPAAHFLGGGMRLDVDRARRAFGPLARAMGVSSPEAAAEGVVRVVEGNMERAIRAITVERGQDPRSAMLFPFGGAAGLHACALAAELGFEGVLVPRDPGLLSAIGVRAGQVVVDRLVPLSAVDPSASSLAAAARPAVAAARREVRSEGFAAREVKVSVFVRARYLRQSIELEIELDARLRRRFDDAHLARFHSADPSRPLEVVGLRVQASAGGLHAAAAARLPSAVRATRPRPVATAPVVLPGGRTRATPIYDRDHLVPGAAFEGPAVVVEYSSTTFVAPGWSCRVDAHGNLRLAPAGSAPKRHAPAPPRASGAKRR